MILIARIISLIASPLVLTVPASYALVFKTSSNASYSLIWTIASVLFAATAGLFVYYGVKKGMFSDYDVSKREERGPLFAFTAIISILYMFIIFLLHGPNVLVATLGALLLGVMIDSVINSKIKASVHLAVFTSFAFILAILYGGIFWILLLLIPIVAWSRIKLKKHKLSETVIGTMIGLFLVIVIYYVVEYMLGIK